MLKKKNNHNPQNHGSAGKEFDVELLCPLFQTVTRHLEFRMAIYQILIWPPPPRLVKCVTSIYWAQLLFIMNALALNFISFFPKANICICSGTQTTGLAMLGLTVQLVEARQELGLPRQMTWNNGFRSIFMSWLEWLRWQFREGRITMLNGSQHSNYLTVWMETTSSTKKRCVTKLFNKISAVFTSTSAIWNTNSTPQYVAAI